MSTLVAKNIQVGADGTASNNFTIYQPAAPDGTLRIGNGNTGTTSAQVVLTSAGNVGIGTSSPTYTLQVNGGINAGPIISAASNTGSVTNTHLRAVISSSGSTSSGTQSAVIASEDTTNSGVRSAVIGATTSSCSSNQSAIVGANRCETTAERAIVLGSRRVLNDVTTSLAMGDNPSGGILTANRKIHLFGTNGNVSIAGTLIQNATFSDFAEFFANSTGQEIPPGTIVALHAEQVSPANEGDFVLGVVSHTAAVLAGDTPFCWQGRYLHDEWGRRVYHDIPDEDWEPKEGQTEADRPLISVLKENPDWNPDLPQVPRSERPDQWTPVGLIGQVFVRLGEVVQPGDFLKAVNGAGFVSQTSTKLRVMKVTKPFNETDGYGIAKCVIGVA